MLHYKSGSHRVPNVLICLILCFSLACMAGVRKGRGRELGRETTREGGGMRGTPSRKPLFPPYRLLNCGGCQKMEFLQITWNLFYVKRVPGAVDWWHLFLVFLQNCLRKGIKRYRANTGENYDKLRPIYEQICCINDRPILLPDANNFIHYND